jgi:hypothetical protein
MKKLLTENAVVVCNHELGIVTNGPTQTLARIRGRRVLVDDNPERRPIRGCPNIGLNVKPCTNTLKVEQGYSALVRVNGRRVCLDTVTGLTDGTPPGTVKYHVRVPGQDLVAEGG